MERASLLVLLALAVGCQSKSNKEKPVVSVEPSEKKGDSDFQLANDYPHQEGVETVNLPGDLTPAPWLEGAKRVVALQRGGQTLIAAAGLGWLKVFTPDGSLVVEHPGAGASQVLEAVDLDGDGTHELLWGRGMGAQAADAVLAMELLRVGDSSVEAEVLPYPETTRHQVVAMQASKAQPGALWIASFVSKYEVQLSKIARDSDGSWRIKEERGRHRVVSDMTVLDGDQLVISRQYGNSADENGGIFEVKSDGSQLQVPSIRGARAILGTEAGLFYADGWHKNYGRKAQGYITHAVRRGKAWAVEARTQIKGNYGFSQLRAGDVHRHPGEEIVASGNGRAVVFLPSRGDLPFHLGESDAMDAAPVQLGGDERAEVVIVGSKPAIWHPR